MPLGCYFKLEFRRNFEFRSDLPKSNMLAFQSSAEIVKRNLDVWTGIIESTESILYTMFVHADLTQLIPIID